MVQEKDFANPLTGSSSTTVTLARDTKEEFAHVRHTNMCLKDEVSRRKNVRGGFD